MNFESMDSTGNLSLDVYGNSLTSMVAAGYDEDDGMNNGTWVSNSQRDLMDTTENAVLLELFFLCERASGEDVDSWDDVRQWLRDHTTAEAREAAMMTGDDNATPLYLACRKCAPVDIIEVLIGVAPQTAQMANNLGWLPMHIACHFGASLEVLRILADAFPASMKSMDKRGRTPLHFALGNVDRPVTPAAVLLLLSGEAGRCPDMGGMLPLHYACAYGASEAVLNVLLEGNYETITARDNKGRTPLHYAMGNCTRDASPVIVRTLLLHSAHVANMVESEGGFLPLHMLATSAEKLTLEQDGPVARTNAQACLDHYLNAKPDTTTEFFTTFQKLPSWLIDHAVQSPIVQMILNRKISERFPTVIQITDFYSLILIIICYYTAVQRSIQKRNDDNSSSNEIEDKYVVGLFLGGSWFALREIVQIISYINLGIFHNWFSDPMNLIDVSQTGITFIVGFVTKTGSIVDTDHFRMVVSILLVMPVLKFILFLRSVNVDFSVFSSGMLNVLINLNAFLITLVIILWMFTSIFYSLFFKSDFCKRKRETGGIESEPFCHNLWQSFLYNLAMLLGEVQNEPFRLILEESAVPVIFFLLFMILLVVLLANVLIAIVTDYYAVVRNERSSIVFWKNRLDFIAEMDALTNFFLKFINRCGREKSERQKTGQAQDDSVVSSRGRDDSKYDDQQNMWDGLMDIFDPSHHADLAFFSWESFMLTFLRFCALIIITIWILAGMISCGILLPEKVPRAFFSSVSDKDKVHGNDMDERLNQLKAIHKGLKQWQESVEIEMASDRKNVIVIKNTVMELQSDVMRQLKEIKQIMTMLFELQGALEMD